MAKKTKAERTAAAKKVPSGKTGKATGPRRATSRRKAGPTAKTASVNNAGRTRNPRRRAAVLRQTSWFGGLLGIAADASVTVTFNCTSPLCQVSLQVGNESTTFITTGQLRLPPGFHQMTMQVQGPTGTPFTLTVVSGAQMQPVNGNASLAGLIPITV